jgi:hypothetical protein
MALDINRQVARQGLAGLPPDHGLGGVVVTLGATGESPVDNLTPSASPFHGWQHAMSLLRSLGIQLSIEMGEIKENRGLFQTVIRDTATGEQFEVTVRPKS